jgi:hypothetical protein
VEGRLPDAAAAGGMHRRRLAGALPGNHPRLHHLRPGQSQFPSSESRRCSRIDLEL